MNHCKLRLEGKGTVIVTHVMHVHNITTLFFHYFSNMAVVDGSVLLTSRHNFGDNSRRAFTPDAPRASRMRDLSQVNSQPLTFDQTITDPGSPKPALDKTTSEEESPTPSLNDTTSFTGSQNQQDQLSPSHDPTSSDQPASPCSLRSDNSNSNKNDESSPETEKLADNKEGVSTLKYSPSITPKSSVTAPAAADDPSVPVIEDIDRNMSVVFRQELLSVVETKIDSKIGIEVSRLAEPDLNVIELFGRCLPDIVPNVILAKRDVCYIHIFKNSHFQ